VFTRPPAHRRRTRRLTAVLITLVASSLPAAPALADHDGPAAERAAREILEARDRANAAAQAMFDAESKIDELEVELARAERDLVSMEAAVAALRDGLTASAIRQFVGATGPAIPLFSDVASSNEQAAAQVYTAAATESELVRADDYEIAVDELEQAQDDIERRKVETERARDDFAQLQAAAEAEVLRLQEIEEQRLHDVAVQHALARQREERAEQERREADAEAARAQANAAPSADSSTSGASSSGSSSGSGSSGSGSSDGTSGSSGSTGASSGSNGSSGSSGSGGSSGSSSGSSASSSIACPVAGASGFADTWGAPRSGGRRHQGVDMMAATGVPLVAAESGRVNFKQTRLGGNSVWLYGNSGTSYFYAHLSGFEGSSRSVARGEVIGYNGSTGNAFTPHLHFEIRPGGGIAVNPYPSVRAAC
jgi:murein DD-endopeptidase MepM/ murein hydrolase activator NlpD